MRTSKSDITDGTISRASFLLTLVYCSVHSFFEYYISSTGSSYWPVFIALTVALLIVTVVIILGIKYIKVKMNDTSPYVKPPNGKTFLN